MSDGQQSTVTLKDGGVMAKSLYRATWMNIERFLQARDDILIYELVEKCKNPDHTFFGDSEPKLRQQGMLDAKGQVHESTRRIVLSAKVEVNSQEVVYEQPLQED